MRIRNKDLDLGLGLWLHNIVDNEEDPSVDAVAVLTEVTVFSVVALEAIFTSLDVCVS